MVDNAVLDERISAGFCGHPLFSTDVLSLVSGQERRMMNRSTVIHRYDWAYKAVDRTTANTLKAFYMDRRGSYKSWLLKDWADYQGTGEVIGTANGAQTAFLLTKTYTAGYNPYTRTIRHVKAGTLHVYVGGLEATNDDSPNAYSHDPATGYINFSSAPSSGSVTATFEFYVPVRFENDMFDMYVNYPDALDVLSVENLSAIEIIP